MPNNDKGCVRRQIEAFVKLVVYGLDALNFGESAAGGIFVGSEGWREPAESTVVYCWIPHFSNRLQYRGVTHGWHKTLTLELAPDLRMPVLQRGGYGLGKGTSVTWGFSDN